MLDRPTSQQRNLNTFETGIDALGGTMLDDLCTSDELEPIRAGVGPSEEFKAKLDILAGYTCGCGNREKAELPYDDPDADADDLDEGETWIATICGVCDGGYNFPRVIEAAEAVSD